MQDLYLSFPDEATADAVLYTGEGDEKMPAFANIDTIGAIYAPTGNTLVDSEGIEYHETEAIPGWHVNVRLMPDEDGTDLQPYTVHPQTPLRVWG